MSLSKKCKSPIFRPSTQVSTQVAGPIRATQEFTMCPTGVSDCVIKPAIRRTASLETLNTLKSHTVSTYTQFTQTDEKRGGEEVRRRHRRSSSLGNCELKEKLRRSLLREKQNVPTNGPICAAHSAAHKTMPLADNTRYSAGTGLLSRTKSMECLNSEIEKITISSSPLSAHTPNDGHKAPLPADTTTVNSRCTQTPDSDMMYMRRTADSVTPPEESTSPWEITRSPDHSSPDQYKIGSSPRVNCSFLFAQRPPSTAAQSTCVKYNIACKPLEPLGPDKSKIKIIFSSNSVFNRPGSTPCYRLSPAEQTCS